MDEALTKLVSATGIKYLLNLDKNLGSCCKNSYVYRTRYIALFQRALKLHACSVLLTKEVAKKSQIDLLTPIYSKTDRITHSKKFRINSL